MNRPNLALSFTIAPYIDLVMQQGTSGTMDYTSGGNLIDDNWIGREYEWDQFNRVTMVKNATGTPLYGFEYGGTGERTVQNTYSGGLVSSTRAFLYDREDVIAEFSNDTFATLFRRYIHGPGIDEPLAILGDDVGEYTYYLHDGLGSVTGVVNESGKLAGSINYSAFGETRLNTVKIENRYRYTSREFVETNLYYYRARHMRPDLGRFISMDPLKTVDGTNMFGYVKNNPVNWKDPYGLASCSAAKNPPINPAPGGGPGKYTQHPNPDLKGNEPWWYYSTWFCLLEDCTTCHLPGEPCACTWSCAFTFTHEHHHHTRGQGEIGTQTEVSWGECYGDGCL